MDQDNFPLGWAKNFPALHRIYNSKTLCECLWMYVCILVYMLGNIHSSSKYCLHTPIYPCTDTYR